MHGNLTVISKVILCRNEVSRIVLLLVPVRINWLPGILVDMAIAIIRTSVSGAWMITFLVEWYICCACSSILVLASSWLHSRSSINLLELSAFMQMHVHEKQHITLRLQWSEQSSCSFSVNIKWLEWFFNLSISLCPMLWRPLYNLST